MVRRNHQTLSSGVCVGRCLICLICLASRRSVIGGRDPKPGLYFLTLLPQL